MATDQTTQISVTIPGLFYAKAFYFCFSRRWAATSIS